MKRILAGWPNLLVVVVVATVWLWPARPQWRHSPAGNIVGFSQDSSSLYEFRVSADGMLPARLLEWSVATGQLTGDTEIRLPGMTTASDVRLSPDGGSLIVSSRAADTSNGPRPTDYYCADTASGYKRFGPMDEWDHVNPAPFSKDGRWIWVYHKPAKQADKFREIDIVSVESGETVLRLRPDADRYPWTCKFANDKNVVAILWKPLDPHQSTRSEIRFVDLLRVKETHRVELTAGRWQQIHDWTAQRARVELAVPDGPNAFLYRCYDLDISSPIAVMGTPVPAITGQISFDTSEQTWWEDGPGWLMSLSDVRPVDTPAQIRLREIDESWGTHFTPQTWGVRVRRLDPTNGWVVHEVPRLLSHPCEVSRDGRWVASAVNGGVELWDAETTPRWYWIAMVGGLCGIGLSVMPRRSSASRVGVDLEQD